MDGQLSFATLDYAGKKKRTKRDVFLAEMGSAVPWSVLQAVIAPHYPKEGPQGGRRAFPIAVMLRIYCLQQWYNLSDPGAEEALYDIQSMRAFCNLELGRDPIPDETTILNFRHLLEAHELTKTVFEAVAEHLEARGALLRGGTIVDATLIAASPSTKNEAGKRDPQMHSSKKANQWYFGMKAHIGVDSRTKLIHAAVATPANVADNTVLPDLLHGKETRVWGYQAYRGQRAVMRRHAPRAQDFVNRRYRHRGVVDEVERVKNRTKSKVRARVEHSIGIIKRVFGFAKVRYRGLKKNTHRLLVTCALTNLFIARRHLLRCQQA